jgi:hypothetical protein
MMHKHSGVAGVKEVVHDYLNAVRACNDYFTAKPDATSKIGFTSYQTCSAIRMLAYGVCR